VADPADWQVVAPRREVDVAGTSAVSAAAPAISTQRNGEVAASTPQDRPILTRRGDEAALRGPAVFAAVRGLCTQWSGTAVSTWPRSISKPGRATQPTQAGRAVDPSHPGARVRLPDQGMEDTPAGRRTRPSAATYPTREATRSARTAPDPHPDRAKPAAPLRQRKKPRNADRPGPRRLRACPPDS